MPQVLTITGPAVVRADGVSIKTTITTPAPLTDYARDKIARNFPDGGFVVSTPRGIAELLAEVEALPEAESGRSFRLTREKRGEWTAQFIGAYVPRARSGDCSTAAEAIAEALADLKAAGERCGVGTLGYREAGNEL